jgi:hypothetical protein
VVSVTTNSLFQISALSCYFILFVPEISLDTEPRVEWALRCQLPLSFQLSQLPGHIVPANSFLNDFTIGDSVRGPASIVLSTADLYSGDRYLVRGLNVHVPAQLSSTRQSSSWISQFLYPYLSAPTNIDFHGYFQTADPNAGLMSTIGTFDLALDGATINTGSGSGVVLDSLVLSVDGLGNTTDGSTLSASLWANTTLAFGANNRSTPFCVLRLSCDCSDCRSSVLTV